jgi:hypothetical protein
MVFLVKKVGSIPAIEARQNFFLAARTSAKFKLEESLTNSCQRITSLNLGVY